MWIPGRPWNRCPCTDSTLIQRRQRRESDYPSLHVLHSEGEELLLQKLGSGHYQNEVSHSLKLGLVVSANKPSKWVSLHIFWFNSEKICYSELMLMLHDPFLYVWPSSSFIQRRWEGELVIQVWWTGSGDDFFTGCVEACAESCHLLSPRRI